MTKLGLDALTNEQLAEQFIRLSLEQYDASAIDDSDAYNARMHVIYDITRLLRRRGLYARRALVPLLEHKNAQVRLNAARELLAVEPDRSRAALEALAASGPFPQRGDAGMSLSFLEDGTYKPT